MSDITVKRAMAKDGKERVYVTAPYHPDFPPQARNAGGKWLPESKKWAFDIRDEERVRNLCRSIYGTDGSDEEPLVTVRVSHLPDDQEWWFAGRQIARRAERDWSVRLGEGVVLIEGGFAGSGGSRNHPRLCPKIGTVLEIRDVPLSLARREVEQTPGAVILEEVPQTADLVEA